MRRGLRPDLRRIHRIVPAVRRRIRGTRPSRSACRSATPKSRAQFVSFSVKSSSVAGAVDRPKRYLPSVACSRTDQRFVAAARDRRLGQYPSPCRPQRPGVAKPSVGSRCNRALLRAAIRDRDPDQNVVRRRLRVFDEDVEVAVVVEDAGVEQLEFRIVPTARAVLLDQLGVRETRACGYL